MQRGLTCTHTACRYLHTYTLLVHLSDTSRQSACTPPHLTCAAPLATRPASARPPPICARCDPPPLRLPCRSGRRPAGPGRRSRAMTALWLGWRWWAPWRCLLLLLLLLVLLLLLLLLLPVAQLAGRSAARPALGRSPVQGMVGGCKSQRRDIAVRTGNGICLHFA